MIKSKTNTGKSVSGKSKFIPKQPRVMSPVKNTLPAGLFNEHKVPSNKVSTTRSKKARDRNSLISESIIEKTTRLRIEILAKEQELQKLKEKLRKLEITLQTAPSK